MSVLSLQPACATLNDLLDRVAFAPLAGNAWLRITGDDRTRWLNGMTTNSIAALAPGDGCYAFFLSAQGRIQADAYAFVEPHSILLETSAAQLEPLQAMLDRYIIMDDVELTPLPAHTGLLLAGPSAEELLRQLAFPVPKGIHLVGDRDRRADVLRSYSPLVPRFELWGDAATTQALAHNLAQLGIPQADSDTLDQLRILEGTPLFGTDIRERDLPQETAPAGTQSRALHFSKGCYLGQEIVERIHSRGNLHRTFSGFLLTGELPAPGTSLFAPGAPDKPLGEITSAALIPLEGKQTICALGYVLRKTLDHAQTLHYVGGAAQPANLPFLAVP